MVINNSKLKYFSLVTKSLLGKLTLIFDQNQIMIQIIKIYCMYYYLSEKNPILMSYTINVTKEIESFFNIIKASQSPC